jgi:hypothetical protein
MMENHHELDHLKELVSLWVMAEVEVLEAEDEATLIETGNSASEVEKLLVANIMRILQERNIDTEPLETAAVRARTLAQSPLERPNEVLTEAMQVLNMEIRAIFDHPEVSSLLAQIQQYYVRIFAAPEIVALNQEITRLSGPILIAPRLIVGNPGLVQELKDKFKSLMRLFLEEEERQAPHSRVLGNPPMYLDPISEEDESTTANEADNESSEQDKSTDQDEPKNDDVKEDQYAL